MRSERWNDNKIVSMLSNSFSMNPLKYVKHWSASEKSEKKYVQISQPYLISQYNRFMGGTDRMDQNIAKVRINIRIKKWWWALFCFAVDVSLQNAWQLYRMSEAGDHQHATLVQFRREVAMTYIMRYRNRSAVGRPLTSVGVKHHKVSAEVRLHGQEHLIRRVDNGQKLCAQCGMKV